MIEHGRPVDGETIAVTTTAKTSTLFRPRSAMIRLSCATTGDLRYRISRDIFKGGDFESKRMWDLVSGVGDVEGALLSRYARWVELALYGGTLGKVALNKTSPLFGDRDAKLTGLTEILTNGDFEQAEAGGVPPGWTEGIVGTGTIVEDAVTFNTGAKSQKFTAGATGVGTNLTQQKAVTASKLYGLIFALYGDGASGVAVQVVDDASGEYLTSAGAWQVAAADVAVQTAAAWAETGIFFETKAGATTLTVKAYVVANNGAGYVDSVGLNQVTTELIQQSFIPVVYGKTMQLVLNHKESAVPASLAVALQPADGAGKYLQSDGTTWNTTEYWFPVAGSTTLAAKTIDFTPNFNGHVLMRIRPYSLGGLTSQLDNIYTWEKALTTDALHPGGTIEVMMDQAGRVSAIMGAGAANLVVETLVP